MIYKITIRSGATYRTTGRDLARATWLAIGDRDPREITTAGAVYGPHGGDDRLVVAVSPDTGDWDGYETPALRVRDEHGRATSIPFSATVVWSEDGRSNFYVGYEEADVTDGWDIHVTARDLLAAAGQELDAPDVDYLLLAEEFISSTDARYLVDEERGFANEWTLIVRSWDRQDVDEDEADLREITPEEAAHYLADAVMDRREYQAIHGCEPYVAAVWQD